jgi:hypothetical protein
MAGFAAVNDAIEICLEVWGTYIVTGAPEYVPAYALPPTEGATVIVVALATDAM